MTGTPSRTATALDVGVTPGVRPEPYAIMVRHRGREGAWGGSCKQSPGLRYTKCIEATVGGQGRSVGRSPMSSGPTGVVATGRWGESHASYPGRSVRLPMRRSVKTTVRAIRNRPGRWRTHAPPRGTKKRVTHSGHGLGKSKDQRRAGRSQQRPQYPQRTRRTGQP